MACNFNCTQLFSPHLKGSIVTGNVLTLIHKQINNEMLLLSLFFLTACLTVFHSQKKVAFLQKVMPKNILLPWWLPFPSFSP